MRDSEKRRWNVKGVVCEGTYRRRSAKRRGMKEKMGVGRGVLTKEVQEIAKKHIGREIDTTELRLIPYVQYVMVNKQKLDTSKISQDERDILRKWKDAKLVEGGASGLLITEDFWDFACEILWQSYVKQEGEV